MANDAGTCWLRRIQPINQRNQQPIHELSFDLTTTHSFPLCWTTRTTYTWPAPPMVHVVTGGREYNTNTIQYLNYKLLEKGIL